MSDDGRIDRAKAQQDYDPDPPRCANCVYWKRDTNGGYIERNVKGRSGKYKTVRFKQRPHPTRNPYVNRCTFGNFEISLSGVCDEWLSKDRERIEDEQRFEVP